MSNTPQKQDYLTFIQWFQNAYPDLYTASWKQITVPPDGEAVTVIEDGLNPEIYKAVIDAVKEYNESEHKS